MNQAIIDITTTPPTPEYLANKRREATAKKTAIARRRRIAIWATVIVVLLTLTGIWVITGFMAEVAISEFIAGALAIAVAGVLAVAGAGAVALALVVAGVLAIVVAGAVAVALAIAGAGAATGVAIPGAIAVAEVGVLVITLFVIYNTHHLQDQLDQADKTLSDLTELNADEYPDDCIEYDSLRSTDQIIEQYHTAIVALGRKPAIAELDAAKAWINSADQRDKTNKAHQACERMMEA